MSNFSLEVKHRVPRFAAFQLTRARADDFISMLISRLGHEVSAEYLTTNGINVHVARAGLFIQERDIIVFDEESNYVEVLNPEDFRKKYESLENFTNFY